jgi:hypothetical protein
VESLEEKIDKNIEDVSKSYERIENTSVEIELPDEGDVEEEIRERGEEIVENLKSDLPGIDFSKDSDAVRDTQEEWGDVIDEHERSLEEVFETVENLNRTANEMEELESEREARREQLDEVKSSIIEGEQ